MDSSQSASKRMSAIPRPGASKLPTFNARPAPAAGLAAPTTRPLPASSNTGRGSAAGIPPVATAAGAKTPQQAPRLTKRSSIAHLPRTASATPNQASSLQKPATARPNNTNGPPQLSKPSNGQRVSSTGAVPRTTQMKRPQSVYGSSLGGPRRENEAQSLSALNGSRGVPRDRSRGREQIREDEAEDSLTPVKPRTSKPPRPSLSDRTIESLHALPSTPKSSRQSDFFSPGGTSMTLATRPKSSLSRNDSITNMPGSNGDGRSLSPSKKISASAKPATRYSIGGSGIPMGAGNRRSMSIPFATKLQEVRSSLRPSQRPLSPAKFGLPTASVQHSTHPLIIESMDLSPEPEIEDEVSEDVMNELVLTEPDIEVPLEVAKPSKTEPEKSKGGLKAPGRNASRSKSPKSRPSLGPAFAPANSDGKTAGEPQRAISSSSTALRQQIAAAKAAARKEKLKHDSPQDSTANVSAQFDVQMHANPFNEAPRDEKHILRNRINTARVDGKLNIAAMSLRKIPDEVLKMYDAKAMEECNVNWAEVVDLTRLIAADNELDELDETVFPDRSPLDVDADGCAEGNQFGGLEFIDLHGNLLSSIPMGLRRLERLTSLNLAHNKLDNAAFDILAEMQSLKDLKLGNNSLSGNLPTSICALPHLENLDLQSNRLLGLPEAMRELVNLKVLNISGNQLTTLPMDALEGLPLIELDASSNLLIASLFPLGGANGHPSLQVLNVANNSLAALTFLESLHLPHLRSLNVSNNHLTVLPSVAGWTDLVTLAVGDNKIAQFPEGFTKLQKLRIVNFASNELRLVDPEVTRMSSLETLILAANPLREKKFLSMSASDIKRELKARMTPSENGDGDDAVPDSPVTVIGAGDHMDDDSTPTSTWQMKSNGVLELIAKNLADDVTDVLASYFQANEVRDLVLHSNKLTYIPPAITFGQDLRSLDLTDNPFISDDYLPTVLDLPFLQELNLSKCRLTTLDPLLTRLRAPHLRSLNVCANRLTGAVPPLRQPYPKLSTFLASDNRFDAVAAAALRGLANVNLASNNLAALPADLGLLWDEGLRHLDVGSNAFRVPNYRILERGTEATLRWLRDKLPAGGAGVVEEIE